MEDHETSYTEGEQQISPLVFLEEEEERGEEEEEESEEEEKEREEEEEERQEEEEKEDAAGQLPGVEEHWEEYELEEELAGGGKMENKDTSEDVGDQSDSSMQSSEHCLGNVGNIQPLKSADKIRISASQRNLQLLDDMIWEKELVVQKTSDTLSACRLRSRMLAKQLDHVDMEIEREEEAGNVAAVSRLQALSSRLCTELEREKELELRIALTLKQNLVEMWQIKTKQGKYDILREQLQKDEEELQMQYQEEREVRIWKEKITALQAEGRRRTQEKREEEAQRECEERNKKILEDAKRNHEKAVCFLRQSMARIHEKNAKEEVKAQEHMERRIQAVLSLKTSITSNRERLQTLQILNKAKALEAKKEEMKMKEAILAEGGNVIREIFLHKRQQEHEKKKEAFRELQKSRKMEIVSRILQEKASIHKQKKSQSPTKAIKARGKLEGPLLQRREAWQSEETCKHADGEISQSWRSPSVCSLAGERTAPQGESSENRPQDVLWESDDEDTERDQTLLVPEFPGLWSQQYDLHKVPKAEDPTRLAIRAMRKRMAEKKMEELQTGILHKQTVPGRGHKGCAFHSKPSCIHFKDFDVGQIYKKKIVLTNASYSVNYCRLVGISECLKDFISVHFDPPGKVSSGMSCEFLVTFKPMINEGLEGEVMFMAQTGPFSVPLKCTVKTCILALDKELIDFGSLVVGETISQTISLTNSGALGTRFKVQTSAGATSTLRATVKSAPARVVTQHSRACDPEEESSESPVAAGDQNKDCAAQEPNSSSAMEQLGQGELNTRSDLDTDNADNLVELSPKEIPVEIMLGKVTEGEIGPFSSVKIPVLFVPAVPGDVRAEFVIVFDNPDCKPLNFSAVGVSVDVPIWVPQPSVDLRICLYERLYQDSVEVRSRATTTLRLKFEVCRELSKHMELLPKTGYIQAQSSFSAQLKFLPRQSLPEDAGSYFNAETGILEVPVTILLVDKAKKVNFTVHAIVTTSDLEISPAQINFGYCTIYEAVQANVILTNKSILPQEFGFVGLPEFVEVQPNDGFGIILPLESLTLDIIFKATKAKEYSFELTCRTEINRQFKLSCKAVGVHPPLELSHSLVQFAATALNSMSSATLDVINSHVDGNPLTHPVPRIGNGDPVPVGPTSFEFHVPRDCPVTITPSVGTVLPGQKSSIRVSFSPALSDQQIGEEAARRLSAAAVPEAGVQSPLGKKKKDAKKEQKKSSVSIPGGKAGSRKSLTAVNSPKEPKPEELKPDSDSYRAAQASLMRSFRGSFNKYIIPCFVASGHATGEEGSGNLTCSPHNTLYLELHCPAVAPPVLITSDTGNNVANFGDIAVGQRMMKRITIENISPGKLELGFSVLNPNGPFLLVRAVGMLEPGESKPLIISFCPREDKWFLETLDIQVAKTNLSLRLSGHGVMPSTVCSVGEVLDMGYVMARDTVTSTVKIENTSTLTLPFSVQLESLSPARDRDRQKIPSFLTSSVQRTEIVGTQNYNGFSVFSVSPTGGKIEAGESQDFVVTFSPDHESLYYSDRLKVLLFGKQTAHEIQLKGAARDHPMFVEGGVPLDVPVESLAVTSPVASQKALERGPQEAVKSLLLLLEYVEGSAEPARAELTVGAMQSPLLTAKKAVEFSLDNAPELQRAGFALDGPKGALERGQLRRIGVSWVPPADLQTSDPPLVSALLTVKGDITESYRVLFMARVVSASAATD
ncbi:cilia- and flagella-associated protein 74 isoform X1 [Corvus kubaryi]|uniref:cilia- and flagella-associated protein 74 isoform X1 n=1 Tax=Corvus kubaryi TaxID=68294 RepID=UPI001C0536CE|nr:cilia- and flagella-associated protein 74 isoform X1 [Corvus kubaryi]XP_041887955.1 cilia- and flagella-associated protein 74 isoform X1 [Corvus kubaryi]